MSPRDLIETARSLTALSTRRPAQANLRRAVSTAYYAVFHCLAATVADTLMGKRRSEAWHQVYRSPEHGGARSACRNRQVMHGFPPEIRSFAGRFIILQKARQRADHALEGRYYKLDVRAAIDMAETAIVQLDRANVEHRRRFAAHVLFRQRPS